MEVVLSVGEYRPGDAIPLHIHHGVEAGYVLEGGMVEMPGNPPSELSTGAPIMNLRDVPHAGWTVVGDKTIKLLTVHIVDKGKPLYDWVKK
jgi:quercetin dioxygenase-like cupin family protein